MDLLGTHNPETEKRPTGNTTTGSSRTTRCNEIVAWMDRYVMSQYDFIAVVERMPESLVVLKYLLGMEWQDLVVLPAKQSGTWYLGEGERSKSQQLRHHDHHHHHRSSKLHCVPLIKPYTTPPVDEYIATHFVQDNWDYYLYAAANRSLDRTIDSLGRSRVEQGVQQLQQLQHLAETKCLSQAIFPCSPNGTVQLQASYTNCYAEDCGCGNACVDKVLSAFLDGS